MACATTRPRRPPVPPADAVHDRRELDRSGDLRLASTDGAPLLAYEAVPTGRPWGRVVVLPDVRGLHPYYRALAERLAETGLHTVAIDYFGRTAADLPRDDEFDYQPHVRQVTPDHVTADVTAAMRHLSPDGAAPVLTLGFCFGGGHSWRLRGGGSGPRRVHRLLRAPGGDAGGGEEHGPGPRSRADAHRGRRQGDAGRGARSPPRSCYANEEARSRRRSSRGPRTRSSTAASASTRRTARRPGVSCSVRRAARGRSQG